MPRLFQLDKDDPGEALAAAVAALRAGELVVVPTETVYGLAALESGAAALDRLKPGRTAPYSRAVADLELIQDRLAPLPRTARRVAARWWPGPVTQVLEQRHGELLGVRVPGHPWTRALCEQLGAPLLLPSANVPGAPAPESLDEVDPGLLEQVAVAIDGGRCALGEASTVLRADTASLLVLRQGVVSRDDLRRHVRPRVLVLCSGNTCRSPMAAELLRDALQRREAAEPGFIAPEVASAGTHAAAGHPASPNAVDVLAARGLDVSDHRSTPLEPARLAEVDLVLCMTLAHLAAAVQLGRGSAFEVALFDPDGREVDDPFGAPTRIYAAVAADLARMAEARVARFCSSQESPR